MLAEWAAAEVALAVVGVVHSWARVRAEGCTEVQAGVAVVRAAGVDGALACAWVGVAFACADELGPCCQLRSCRAGLPCVVEVVPVVCTVLHGQRLREFCSCGVVILLPRLGMFAKLCKALSS